MSEKKKSVIESYANKQTEQHLLLPTPPMLLSARDGVRGVAAASRSPPGVPVPSGTREAIDARRAALTFVPPVIRSKQLSGFRSRWAISFNLKCK